jgi:CcmD family protein
MTYLYAAYVATWAIHIAYVGTLLRRYTQLKREIEELKTRIEKN